MCVRSHVWLFETPWTVAHQALLSMGFPRQDYWNGLPFPSPADLPGPGIEFAPLCLLSDQPIKNRHHWGSQRDVISPTDTLLIDKCSALWGLPWIIAGSFLPLYNTSPLECHLVPSWTKKVIQFLLHLVWLFIFLSFQEHTNTVSCGPYQAINHHCHISELSLNNFIFQGSRFINISTLRMECHIHLQLLMAHTS